MLHRAVLNFESELWPCWGSKIGSYVSSQNVHWKARECLHSYLNNSMEGYCERLGQGSPLTGTGCLGASKNAFLVGLHYCYAGTCWGQQNVHSDYAPLQDVKARFHYLTQEVDRGSSN